MIRKKIFNLSNVYQTIEPIANKINNSTSYCNFSYFYPIFATSLILRLLQIFINFPKDKQESKINKAYHSKFTYPDCFVIASLQATSDITSILLTTITFQFRIFNLQYKDIVKSSIEQYSTI